MSKINSSLATGGSSLNKYKMAVTGNTSNLSLLRYEWFTLFVTPLPGWLGKNLRRWLYPFIFEKIGKNSVVEANCTIRQAERITLGAGTKIGKYVTLDVRPGGTGIHIGDDVTVGEKTIIISSQDLLDIGRGTRIGEACRIGSIHEVKIGRNCTIGDEVCFVAAGHTYDRTDIPIIDQPITTRGAVTVGDNVRIGHNTTIMDGVTIGSNVEIVSHSFVNKDVPADTKIAGVPAQDLNVSPVK